MANDAADEKVVQLKVVPAPQYMKQDCIELLEEYLEAARAGRIQSVAIIGIKADESASYGFSHSAGKLSLIGATFMLQNLLRDELKKFMFDDDGETDTTDGGDNPSA